MPDICPIGAGYLLDRWHVSFTPFCVLKRLTVCPEKVDTMRCSCCSAAVRFQGTLRAKIKSILYIYYNIYNIEFNSHFFDGLIFNCSTAATATARAELCLFLNKVDSFPEINLRHVLFITLFCLNVWRMC